MVLNCLAKGLTYKQIADQLDISIDTIRTYLRRIYEKLHVQSRTEAVAKYLSQERDQAPEVGPSRRITN